MAKITKEQMDRMRIEEEQQLMANMKAKVKATLAALGEERDMSAEEARITSDTEKLKAKASRDTLSGFSGQQSPSVVVHCRQGLTTVLPGNHKWEWASEGGIQLLRVYKTFETTGPGVEERAVAEFVASDVVSVCREGE